MQDIVDALEMPSDEYLSFVNLDTGEVETVSRDLLSQAEEPDDGETYDEEWERAKRIAATDRFAPLPTSHDIHEWSIVEDFVLSLLRDALATI